jgi:ribosome-associated protein
MSSGDDISLPDGRRFPRAAVAFSASRAGGPGGQHVNTSSTRVELRVPVEALPLTGAERALVRERLASRIGADDALRVVAASERSQALNRTEAERRLARLIGAALRTEPARVPTRPSRAARQRRREEKAAVSRRKAERRPPPAAGEGD